MSASQEIQAHVGRRTVVAAGATGLAVVLTACGGGSKDSGGSDTAVPAGEGDGANAGTALASTADIPEGGGMVFAEAGVVVTQPKAGEFKAFSSKCTHQGCAVKGIADGVITCPCHNSTFDAATGEVTGGPATQPLPEKQIRVEGDSITLA
ncbi:MULTISPECIES: Rieske (2Fe-2S) protein [unclassified Streptomyces]|uniref:Rieske (2Fe-2S) protein n=1 Tax=unclassified Streptomyces TaxID=2593676 RepID=UPI000CDB3E60|nr:Rieske (2Fe-2S) protein [Streptomyces sp. SM10]